MAKKGFTMVELLAVIAILAIIILIAVPIFGGVRNRTNQSVYESKIANVKAAAEAYAEESGRTVFDIRTLIEQGKIEADNESGEYRNPINGQDMKCYIVNVTYQNLHYYASVHESSKCYSNDELEEMYGAVKIVAYNASKSDVLTPINDNWYKEPVLIGYKLTSSANYTASDIVKVVWQGDRSFSCSKAEGNLSNCDIYGEGSFGINGSISNMKVNLEVTFKNETGAEFSSKTSKVIAVDMEGPRVVSVVAGLGNTNQSGKRVDIEMTDGNGSGLLEYKMVKVASASSPLPICANESGYKPVTQSKMIEYQDNGIYYTCVRDKVGNDNQNTLASSKIEVTGVDYSHVNGKSFKVVSSGESTPLKTKATIVLNGSEDTSKLKMCVSNTGFLKGCSFQTYKSNFDWTVTGNADCNNRTVYLSISDAAGNVTNIVSNPYSPVDTVKYDANGGTLVTASDSKKTACYNGKYALPSARRTGYTFDGWYTAKNGGTKITSTSKVNFNGLKTLYAHWKVNTYTISYNLDGGAHGTNHPTSATYDKTITINNPTRVGYTFNGWTINGMDATTHTYGTATTKATSLSGRKETIYKNLRATAGRVTFKATWVANKYTIAYNLDGGAFGASHPTSATYNVAVTINNPTRTGYIFNGWTITGMDATTHNYGSATTKATSLSGRKETSYKNLRATSGTVTFKATWKTAACANCTVTFNGNGGVWDQKTEECSDVYYRSAGITVSDNENFEIPYYRNVNGSCNKLQRYYANRVTRKNDYCTSYDVFYKRNRGSYRYEYQCRINHLTTQTSAVKNGKIQSFPVEPYKIGFYFDGWYTEANGGTKINENTMVGQNTTYYAHWIDLANTFDINNYGQSKIVACRDDLFQRLIDTYTSKFSNAVNNSQNFRNAMYDCGSVAANAINSSQNGYPILRQSGRTTIVSGSGRNASCTCYPNKESKSAMKTCDKPACSGEYEQFVSGNIYSGRVFILSATVEHKPGDHGTSSSKCGDDDGYGNCENEGRNFEVDGYRSIIMAPSYGEASEVVGWGYCNSRTNNAVLNTGECYDETENRIAKFQDGLKVGLYSCIDKYYDINDGRNDRTYNEFKSYTVYTQIFKI